MVKVSEIHAETSSIHSCTKVNLPIFAQTIVKPFSTIIYRLVCSEISIGTIIKCHVKIPLSKVKHKKIPPNKFYCKRKSNDGEIL